MRAPRVSQGTTTLAASASVFEKKILERPRRRAGVIIGVAVVVLATAGAIVAVRPEWLKKTPPPVSAPEAAAPPAPVSPPPVAPPAMVEVTITSRPADALVVRERDGAVLGRTPFKEAWRKASGVERLRLELDGHRPERVTVPLDRGVEVTIDLKKDLEPAPHARPKHKPAKPAPKNAAKEPVPI
jgi:hypothetical protein